MANYGKVKLRNLDEEVISLINSIPKSGSIKLSDLSKELRDKFNSLDLIVNEEDTLYINYNDEQLKEAIREATENIQQELGSYRKNDNKININDLDDSVKEAINNAQNNNGASNIPQEQFENIFSEFNDVKDEVRKLADSGPTRGIVKFLYIANTPKEEELYKSARLSPIYKPSTDKVYELILKTEKSGYLELNEEQEGVEGESVIDSNNLDDYAPQDIPEINNDNSAVMHFFTGNSEPQNANIGDVWVDTSENANEVDVNPDTSIYDEWDITDSEWREIPNGLFDRNFARSIIYEPIKRKIYYCSMGKLTPIKISSDDEMYDIAIPMNYYTMLDIPNAYAKNIRILVLNNDNNSPEYGSYSPAKDTDFQMFIYKSQVKIKNVTNKTAYLKIIY